MDYSRYQGQSPARWCIRLAQAGLGLILWITILFCARSPFAASLRKRAVMPGFSSKIPPPAATFNPATNTFPDPTQLTASDRCDRCCARAVTRIILASGLDLLFCRHHASENSAALSAQIVEAKNLLDELEELFNAPSSTGATAS